MHFMHKWILLCNNRSLGCDWYLRCGNIFCVIFIGMFILPCCHVLCCVGIDLYKLRSGLFSVLHWLKLMFIMHSGLILCDGRAIGGDGGMCSWIILTFFCDDLLKLSRWDLLGFSFFLELLKLFDRNVCDDNWLDCLHGMPRRIILRDHRSLGSDGFLRSRNILNRIIHCLYKLCNRNRYG